MRLVQKFGGTSVGTVESIENVANKIKLEVDQGNEVAVVVSAMAGETNRLVGLIGEIVSVPDFKEYDTVISSGEQVTIGLLALKLQTIGLKSRSWLGAQ